MPAVALIACLSAGAPLFGYELFIHRPEPDRSLLSSRRTIVIHGELFGQLLSPSTFPSFTDQTGLIDRWNYGFRDVIYFSAGTRFLAQMVAHDDGHNRTKFDWHFTLRQEIARNLAVFFGHDSDHDSDRGSRLDGRSFYTNRNYLGLSAPFSGEDFLVEPFLRFFLGTTNQRTRLDLSGEVLKQESGLRLGARFGPATTLSLQALIQSSAVFDRARAWLADVCLRLRLTDWLEASVGGGLWRDWDADASGRRQTFSKLFWGIAVPF